MKHSLTLLCCLLISTAFAQTDSTAIKLEQYKKWHDQGIITDADYDGLRTKLLGLQPGSVVKVSSPFADSSYRKMYRNRFKAEIYTGSVCLPVGVGAGVTALIIYLQAPGPNTYVGSNEYIRFIKNRNTAAAIVGPAGGALTIAGAVLLGMGLHQRDIYRTQTLDLRTSIGPTGIGLNLAFTGKCKPLRL